MSLESLLSKWIKKVEQEHPPGDEIVAINFGMLQSDKGYMVYITGAEIYDANDDDWAGEIDYQPSRANKYLLLPREITTGLKWVKVLELVIDTLRQMAEIKPEYPLFTSRTITAGFDDGKLTVIKSE